MQLKPCSNIQLVEFAVLYDAMALDILHRNVGNSGVCGSSIDDPRNVGMLHVGEHLYFSLESLEDLLMLCVSEDQFNRNISSNWRQLLG